MSIFISPSGAEVTIKDWSDAKARHVREVVQRDKPLMFCVACEFDPNLNPDKNVVDCLKEAVALISNIFGLNEKPIFTRYGHVHEVRFKSRICSSTVDLALMMNHLFAKIESPSLRVKRRIGGAVCEAWLICFEEAIKSVSLESEADLIHPPMDKIGSLFEAPKEWKRKTAWLEKCWNYENGPRKPIKADSSVVRHFLESIFPEQEMKALSVTPLYEKRVNKLMPSLVRLVLDTTVCGVHKDNIDHSFKCTFIDVTETGQANMYCSHCDKSKFVPLLNDDHAAFKLLSELWSESRWIKAMNKTYTQLANGHFIERMIDDEGELRFVERTNIVSYLKGHAYPVWLTKKKKSVGRPRKDEAEEEEQKEWSLKEVGLRWLESLERARCKEKIFNPKLEPGIRGDFLNMYEGFGIQPKAPASGDIKDAAPLLRKHLREVICNNDDVAADYLEHCLAQLVRYPYIKLGVVFVLKAKQGAGKNTLLDVLRKIFGRHGVEVNNSRHVTGNFNQHLALKICIILNEAVWGGDKQSEGTLKASITEATAMFEPKGVDAREGRNYWTFFISSNEKWCVPASPEVRRFFMLPVSDSRIGDAAYFTALHNAIQNGEDREFLWYLLKRPCVHPDQWKPAHNMPPRSSMIVDQMMQDRSQSLLRFLVGQLKEDGEWILPTYGDATPIIQKGKETKVHRKRVLVALQDAAKSDPALRNQLGQQNALTVFLQETLGHCFSNDKRFLLDEMVEGCTNDKCYWFAPAEEIMKHLSEKVLCVPNYFGDVPMPPNKRR
jgi:Family of unknown function (DUF5906)